MTIRYERQHLSPPARMMTPEIDAPGGSLARVHGADHRWMRIRFPDHLWPAVEARLSEIRDFARQPKCDAILPLGEVNRSERALYYELGDGRLLGELLADGRQKNARAAAELVHLTATALENALPFARSMGIQCHGSLTPWRIVIYPGDPAAIRFLGFGLRAFETLDWKERVRVEVSGRGTSPETPERVPSLRYSTPHQLDMDHEEDTLESDIFALGLIAAQIAVGRPLLSDEAGGAARYRELQAELHSVCADDALQHDAQKTLAEKLLSRMCPSGYSDKYPTVGEISRIANRLYDTKSPALRGARFPVWARVVSHTDQPADVPLEEVTAPTADAAPAVAPARPAPEPVQVPEPPRVEPEPPSQPIRAEANPIVDHDDLDETTSRQRLPDPDDTPTGSQPVGGAKKPRAKKGTSTRSKATKAPDAPALPPPSVWLLLDTPRIPAAELFIVVRENPVLQHIAADDAAAAWTIEALAVRDALRRGPVEAERLAALFAERSVLAAHEDLRLFAAWLAADTGDLELADELARDAVEGEQRQAIQKLLQGRVALTRERVELKVRPLFTKARDLWTRASPTDVRLLALLDWYAADLSAPEGFDAYVAHFRATERRLSQFDPWLSLECRLRRLEIEVSGASPAREVDAEIGQALEAARASNATDLRALAGGLQGARRAMLADWRGAEQSLDLAIADEPSAPLARKLHVWRTVAALLRLGPPPGGANAAEFIARSAAYFRRVVEAIGHIEDGDALTAAIRAHVQRTPPPKEGPAALLYRALEAWRARAPQSAERLRADLAHLEEPSRCGTVAARMILARV